ncbi:glycosyltransferase family 4 protein [Kineosporia sp. R_H_3]|uniref:glycosyltransferase family 4 protein n=1 Tax=Kineosporia sp. R_H_3 TaxID=1961848 RepID=UPI000B4A8012|nr:glycosyltransferase family 4 protein [Kineosporia sp. R_H_3]
MRVLLTLGTSGGGVGRHVRALEQGLAAAGADVRVAGPPATAQAFGFERFDPVEVSDRPRPGDVAAVRRLRRLGRDVDVVHAHGLRAGALAVLARAGARRGRRPALVVTLHNALVSGGRIAAVHAVLERLVARGADAVLVVSGDLGARMRALGASQVDLAVVPAPVREPTPGILPAAVRAALGVPERAALLVTVARLAPQKGLDLLLDAVGRLGADGVPVHAVVAGGGPLAAPLQARIDAERLPVRLLGHRDDVPDLLAAADVVVSPSVWEGQPLNLRESLRAGAAIVATEVGGVAAVVGDAAVLVPYGDPAVLADAVAKVVTDADLAADLRRRAVARAGTLPTDADAVAQVRAVYTAVVRPA